jgi:hypothetical protein
MRGSRHWRLMVDGRQVGVVSFGNDRSDFRATENMRADIRRFGRSRLSS